jgi:hypothetical protein
MEIRTFFCGCVVEIYLKLNPLWTNKALCSIMDLAKAKK